MNKLYRNISKTNLDNSLWNQWDT